MTVANLKVIEVEELKDKLGTVGNRDDEELERLCIIASLNLEAITNGTAFIKRTFTEDYDGGVDGRRGGAKRIYLRHGPIVSVTSITDDDSNTIPAADYTIVNTGNVGWYLEHDHAWTVPVGRWTIVYVAGVFTATADVDWNVKEAARLEAIRIRSQKGDVVQSTSLSGRAGSRTVTKQAPGMVSAAARVLIKDYIRRTF